jgi:hypothetical protein
MRSNSIYQLWFWLKFLYFTGENIDKLCLYFNTLRSKPRKVVREQSYLESNSSPSHTLMNSVTNQDTENNRNAPVKTTRLDFPWTK